MCMSLLLNSIKSRSVEVALRKPSSTTTYLVRPWISDVLSFQQQHFLVQLFLSFLKTRAIERLTRLASTTIHDSSFSTYWTSRNASSNPKLSGAIAISVTCAATAEMISAPMAAANVARIPIIQCFFLSFFLSFFSKDKKRKEDVRRSALPTHTR